MVSLHLLYFLKTRQCFAAGSPGLFKAVILFIAKARIGVKTNLVALLEIFHEILSKEMSMLSPGIYMLRESGLVYWLTHARSREFTQ